jgi:hypothetical protein
VFAEERAEYFIVFDREGLSAPEYTKPVAKYINRDGSLANATLENTGRNEVVFGASTVINLRDMVSEGMQRLIYWGQNSGVVGWWNRLQAIFKIAERGYA